MGRTKTRKMVIGSMIAGIFGALSLINTYTGGMMDVLICYVMVIPLTWYGYTYTLKDNVIVCIVSMLVIAMVGLPFFIISSISSCLAGLFLGEALKRKAKKETILLGTFCTSMLNNVFLYEVFSGLLGMNLEAKMTMMYEEMIAFMPKLSQLVSLDMMLSLIPLVLVILSVMEMYVIVLLCQLVLSRLKIEFPGSFHIAAIQFSKKTGIVLIVSLFASYYINKYVYSHIYLTYIYILCMLALGLEGLSFVNFYLIVIQKPKLSIFAMLSVLVPIIDYIYVGIGILDIFGDLRRILLYNIANNE